MCSDKNNNSNNNKNKNRENCHKDDLIWFMLKNTSNQYERNIPKKEHTGHLGMPIETANSTL